MLEPKFEDYQIQTGYTNAENIPYAAIEEFFALSTLGETHEEAIEKLKVKFEERIKYMKEKGQRIPFPGEREAPRFAPNDQIEALRPFVDEFWSEILGASYATSFVSNESKLSTWESYVSCGRPSLIQKVKEKYGVDISTFYDEPIPVVLRRIQEASN